MKNIVVAIDFSKSSVHALEYSIKLANKAEADIHMVWVDNTSTPEVVYAHFTNEERLEHKKRFEELKEEYEGKLLGGNLNILMRKGKVHLEMAKVARQKNADIIVAGTHGVTGYEEYWIGSNAYRIVTYAPCPVITVKNNFEFDEIIQEIVFPIDSSVETKQKLPFTVSLAKLFNARVHLLGIYSTGLKSIRKRIDHHVEHAIKYLEEHQVEYDEERAQAENQTRFIINFAEKRQADLIAIMTEQESTQANVFLGETPQQLISFGQIPILSLRPKEIIVNKEK